MKTYHKNPRQITEKQFGDLSRWLEQLGDLSGIVHNLETDEIIGGNQRARVFDLIKSNGATVIELTQEYDPPTAQGTVAEGYVTWKGSRYGYRQVRWDDETAELANLVANHAGGTFDWDILANEWDEEVLRDAGFEDWELGFSNDAPPSLDDLADEYGEPNESDFWPVIKVKVSPETFELWESLLVETGITDDAQAVAVILGAVDATVLGAVVS